MDLLSLPLGQNDLDGRKAAKLVCTQANPALAYSCYLSFRTALQGWRFIFSAKSGEESGVVVNRSFSRGAVVRSAFSGDRVLVLDEIVARGMERGGRAIYGADWSISLDTQALSCIQPFLDNRVSRLPEDFEEVFMFLAREDVNFDWLPYAYENLKNVRQERNRELIYRKVRGYEVLRSIDAVHLRKTRQVRSKLTVSELDNSARALVDQMLTMASNESLFKEISAFRRFLFCILLKIVLIQLSHPQRSLVRKLNSLLDFMDGELGCISTGEAMLAIEYFTLGQELKFFGEIQIKKPNLLAILNRMAWDLFHVRQLVSNLRLRDPEIGARYFFPAILTFDKDLPRLSISML